MHAKPLLFSAILCLASILLLIYGLYSINPRDPISGSYMVIVSVFLGMAGMFILVMQFAPSGHSL